MSVTSSIALCLAILTADPQVGDTVVTLTSTPVMNGSATVAEVEPGVELTVTGLKSPWVGIIATQDGKEVKGWGLEENLILAPGPAFAKLFVRFDPPPTEVKKYFERIDANRDQLLSIKEFTTGSNNQTLDDLNVMLREVVQRVSKEDDPRKRQFMLQSSFQLVFMGVLDDIAFRSWKRKPSLDEMKRMTADFLATKDIRRSQTAQELLDRADSITTAKRAAALFKWADTNKDGNLSVDEFTKAATAVPIPILIKRLNDQNTSTRFAAIERLRELGAEAKAAIPALVELLNDKNISIRYKAIDALQGMGAEAQAAIPSFIALLKDGNIGIRFRAIDALSQMGPHAKIAVPALTELLQDHNPAIRRRAEEALRNIGAKP